MLNSTGNVLNVTANGTFINPIRNLGNSATVTNAGNIVVYNQTTRELATTSIPSFSAVGTIGAVVSGGAGVVIFNSVQYDTDLWYDRDTGRYTPQRAGWYSFAGGANPITPTSPVTDLRSVQLRKNAGRVSQSGSFGGSISSTSRMVFMNGTTDYVEVYVACPTAGTAAQDGVTTFFNGYWVSP